MKKLTGIVTCLILAGLLLISGCDGILPSLPETEAAEGMVVVSFSAGRMALSPQTMNFDLLNFKFYRASGSTLVLEKDVTDNNFVFVLPQGTGYTLDVECKVGNEGNYTLAATGTSSVFNVSSSPTTREITLSGVKNNGEGDFSWEFTFLDSDTDFSDKVTIKKLYLFDGTGEIELETDAAGTCTLDAGGYFLALELSNNDDKRSSGYANGLVIYPGQTTTFKKNFTDADFHYTVLIEKLSFANAEINKRLSSAAFTEIPEVAEPSAETDHEQFDLGFNWSSSNPGIVTVDPATGEVTVVSTGSANISAAAKDGSMVSASYTVNVYNDIDAASLDFRVNDYPVSPKQDEENVFTAGVGNETPMAIVTFNYPDNATVTRKLGEGEPAAVVTNTFFVNLDSPATYIVTVTVTPKEDDAAPIVYTLEITRAANPVTGIILVNSNTLQTFAGKQYEFAGDIGATFNILAQITPSNPTDGTLVWSSSDVGVATVSNPSGNNICTVTIAGIGPTRITAANNASGISDYVDITVPADTKIRGILSVTDSNDSTYTIPVTMNPALDNPVTIRSATENVIISFDYAVYNTVSWKIGETGTTQTMNGGSFNVNGLAPGETKVYITITAPDYTSSAYTLVINKAPPDIKITGITLTPEGTVSNPLKLYLNSEPPVITQQLTPVFTPANPTDTTLIWNSSNTTVATVNNGLVSAISAGDATITATTNDGSNLSASAVFKVFSGDASLTNLKVNTGDASGGPVNFNSTVEDFNFANVTFNKAPSASVAYTVSAGTHTSTDMGGVYSITISNLQPGNTTVTITVTADDGITEGVYTLMINRVVYVNGILLSEQAQTMYVGGPTITFTNLTVLPGEATNKAFKWVSDDTAVATIDENTGVITAVGAGTANISALALDQGTVESNPVVITVVANQTIIQFVWDEDVLKLFDTAAQGPHILTRPAAITLEGPATSGSYQWFINAVEVPAGDGGNLPYFIFESAMRFSGTYNVSLLADGKFGDTVTIVIE